MSTRESGAVETATTTEEVQTLQVFARLRESQLFVSDHYATLLKRYPERWIAVLGSSVVDSDSDIEALAGRVRERGSPAGLIQRFMTAEPRINL